MDRWAGRVAIVTGANSGIGFAIAKALTLKGMVVLGVDLKKEKMEGEIQSNEGKGKFYGRVCDITNEKRLTELFEWVKKNLGGVHVLVNSAGIVSSEKIIDSHSSVWKEIINVNLLGLMSCCHKAVKIMKECGQECHIINICSIVGHRIFRCPRIDLNVYPLSKYAVRAVTTTLERELLGTKIRTTNLCPSYVKTQMTEEETLKKIMADAAGLEPEDVAESVIYILGVHPRVLINELTITAHGEVI